MINLIKVYVLSEDWLKQNLKMQYSKYRRIFLMFLSNLNERLYRIQVTNADQIWKVLLEQSKL